MKTSGFAYGLRGVAAATNRLASAATLARTGKLQGCVVVGLATLAMLLSGCASPNAANSTSSTGSGFEESQASPFGTIAFVEEGSPATFGFRKAKGKLGSAQEAILDSATVGLSAPGAGVFVTGAVLSGCAGAGGDPIYTAAFAGAAGGVALVGVALAGPVVGVEGLIRSMKKVSPAELAQREAALTNGLCLMAAQQPFRDALLQAGAERIRGGFVPREPQTPPDETATIVVDALLEAHVDELRLERAGSSEGSYFLRIKTHARLSRVSDGVVCFEQQAEYRSDKALFLDWTLRGAIEGVAETGYQELARYYVDQLLRPRPNGGGYLSASRAP